MSVYMVRIVRDLDEEYAEFAVKADTPEEANRLALAEVQRDPDSYFGEVPKPSYSLDTMSEPEIVDEAEYLPFNDA